MSPAGAARLASWLGELEGAGRRVTLVTVAPPGPQVEAALRRAGGVRLPLYVE